MAEKSDILVDIKNLKKYFPVHRGLLYRTVGNIRAVDGVSLTIERGETLGLVGETGSGKTTLGRAILRLITVDAGEVWFEGKNVLALRGKEMKALRREMQIIFQDPYGSLNPRMKAGDIIAEGLRIFRRGSKAEVKKRVTDLLETVGLDGEAGNLYPHEFSGGQRQRIGIARALALNPKFIVCDEPVSSLDVSIQAQILNLLDDLQSRFGLTYLFIAHDLSVVEHISERVAVMYLGKVVEEASNRELYQNPLHPYTRALLESIPVPDPAISPHPPREKSDADSRPGAFPSGCGFFPRCPVRRPECRETVPLLRDVSPGHRVACHIIG